MADRAESTADRYEPHPPDYQTNPFLPSFILGIGDPEAASAFRRVGEELGSWCAEFEHFYPEPRDSLIVAAVKAGVANLRQVEGFLSWEIAHHAENSALRGHELRLALDAARWAGQVRDLADEMEATIATA